MIVGQQETEIVVVKLVTESELKMKRIVVRSLSFVEGWG